MAHLDLIDEREATGDLAREYEAAVERAGKVMNILKAMGFRPAVLRRFLELNREINFGPSRLSRLDRELLAVVVSVANGCRYSTLAHVDLLAAEGASRYLIEHAQRDYLRAGLDAAHHELCDFAVKLTLRPSTIRESDIERLRARGYDDVAIHDAIQVVAFFNYVNRVANAVGVDDEPEWALTGRQLGE